MITSDQPICFKREMTLFLVPRREIAPQCGHLKTSLETYFPHLPQYAMISIVLISSRSTYVYLEILVANIQIILVLIYPPPLKKVNLQER